MISNFDYYKKVISPEMYLCNPNQDELFVLKAENKHLVLRFNDLSELTFAVPKEEGLESHYDLVETKRLIKLENIGWFQITSVTETIEGNRCIKSVTAESHQTEFKDRGFFTENRVYMFYNPNDPTDSRYDANDETHIPSVVGQLYQQLGIKINLSVDGDVLEDQKEWVITKIGESLKFNAQDAYNIYTPASGTNNICRNFTSNNTMFGYDFMVNEASKAFGVVFIFDFLYHTIKIDLIDNVISPTDIYLSMDNLLNNINVTENAENITTVLNCNGTNADIRCVNPMGTNYVVNFDYYAKEKSDDGKVDYPWMSEDLINALRSWKIEYDSCIDEGIDGKTYSDGVMVLCEYNREQSEAKTELTKIKTKLNDFQNAIDEINDGSATDEDSETGKILPSGYYVAETIAIDENSIDPSSEFNNIDSVFNAATSLTCYKQAPTPNYSQNTNRFAFTFDEGLEEKTGLIDSMVGSIDETDFDNKGEYQGTVEDTSAPYLYFSDAIDEDNSYSYCKLLPAIAVGNLYDSTGNLAETDANKDFKTKGEVFFVTIRDIKFKIDNGSVYVGTDGNDGEIIYGTTAVATISGDKFIYNGATYKINKPYMGIASITTCYVKGYEKYVPAIEVTGEDGWINLWQARASSQEAKIERLQSQIDSANSFIQSIHERCSIEKFIKRLYNGDALYSELRNYWIEGEYQNENIEVLEDASFSEIIDLSTQLKEAGEKELEKVSQPTFTMTAQAVNFLRLIEFKSFIDQVGLGKTVTIEKSRDVHYHPVLMSMEYDIDSSENFSLSFSNAVKMDETAMTYADLIKEASNTSRTISANWSNLIDYSKNKSTFERLINDPLNKTLSAARINDANQEFVVDKTGILGRTYTDESKTSFDNKQLRIRNNVLLFTDDGWQTARLALGECFDGNGNSMGYGLIADTIVGTMIIGETLKIANENNRITLDETGITIKKLVTTTNEDGTTAFEYVNSFYADSNGNVTIAGTIHADDGHIGNFDIRDGAICLGVAELEKVFSLGYNKTYIGTDGIEYRRQFGFDNGGGLFLVDELGEIMAQNDNGGGLITRLGFRYDGLRVSNEVKSTSPDYTAILMNNSSINAYYSVNGTSTPAGHIILQIIEDEVNNAKTKKIVLGAGIGHQDGYTGNVTINSTKLTFVGGILTEVGAA